MTDRAAFRAAFEADELDASIRLVFADWLEDHGEEDFAKFVRLREEIGSVSWPYKGKENELEEFGRLIRGREDCIKWMDDLGETLTDYAEIDIGNQAVIDHVSVIDVKYQGQSPFMRLNIRDNNFWCMHITNTGYHLNSENPIIITEKFRFYFDFGTSLGHVEMFLVYTVMPNGPHDTGTFMIADRHSLRIFVPNPIIPNRAVTAGDEWMDAV